ncbi:MAG TPA: FbpB family small basic protein [Bacillota bacterium]
MSLKRRLSFEELVEANREQILQDKERMEQIEKNMERRLQQSFQKNRPS